ncbi:efflux transporter outer membrane subunit [Ideonella livida]|uniref:Efflux transporter outer membrane subunit n=1 Tax=Ideonella livida TaxID=2707176 RepID=A0A7C9THF5_9BURK|nr:efflux transporter outer membrane subunit [Ideonella livida]NDY90378.1 efflux transporter outer membrane subunit [Ideonella livida]
MRPDHYPTRPGRAPSGLPARRAASLAAALAVGLTLSACGTLGPDSAQQRADARAQLQAQAASAVPADWPAASATLPASPASAPTADAAALEGQALVQDARLRQVIALALQANRDLRVAVFTLEQARATYRIQEAASGPTLNANAGLSASRTPAEASSAGRDTVSRAYSAGLGISAWEIDLFNRVGSLRDSALQAYLAAEATQRSTRLALVADVATAWLTLGADQQLLALYRQTLASQQQTLGLTEKRQALGAASGLTVAQTRATVESARASVATYESQVQRDRTALELLVGQRLPEALLPPTPDSGTATQAAVPAAALVALPEGLPSEVLRRRPDVQAAEAVVQGAQADLAAARAALYPRITLTASAGTASRSLEDLFQGGAWSFAPSVTLPLLDGGAARTTAQKAEITRDLRLASYDKTVQTAFKEVADALSVRASLQQRLSAQQALVEANTQAVRLSQARWQAGADGYLTLLDAQRSLLAAQQGLISLQLTEQANRVTLFKVLGGT